MQFFMPFTHTPKKWSLKIGLYLLFSWFLGRVLEMKGESHWESNLSEEPASVLVGAPIHSGASSSFRDGNSNTPQGVSNKTQAESFQEEDSQCRKPWDFSKIGS